MPMARGVIHRDLKPSNILVTFDGQPHVLDFGLARPVGEDSGMTISVSGDVSGTPAYMSPEQASGSHGEIDARTDVYSLGVMLYRLLVGQSPHELTGTHFEIMKRLVEEQVRLPRSLQPTMNRRLEAVLLKALSNKPGGTLRKCPAVQRGSGAIPERRAAAGGTGDDGGAGGAVGTQAANQDDCRGCAGRVGDGRTADDLGDLQPRGKPEAAVRETAGAGEGIATREE